jgi:hypothetical protein
VKWCHQESATTNTAFNRRHKQLSISFGILMAIQEAYLEAENDAYENMKEHSGKKYKGDGKEYFRSRIHTRLSEQDLADRFKVEKKTIKSYLKRLKDWLPEAYQQKTYSLDEWFDGIKTDEGLKTYYAIFNLLFNNDNTKKRTESDILHHLVLKEPEDIEEWWILDPNLNEFITSKKYRKLEK